MGGMRVVKGNFKPLWVPVGYTNGSTPIYVGSVIARVLAGVKSGFETIAAATGAGDITNDDVQPFGVVKATNNLEELYNATYHSAYITDAQTQALQLATKKQGVDGPFIGDPAPYVQVDLITAETVIKAPICFTSYGTAVTEYTETIVSTTGVRVTTAAIADAPEAGYTTWYCRSGLNKGLYRIGYDTSTTAHDFAVAWPYDTAVGDKFVYSHLALGTCKAQFDTLSMCILGNSDYASHYYWIDVLEINLKEAGKEYALFRFNPFNFLPVR